MLRIDRFLTLHVFRHLVKVLPEPKGVRIPILMYHSISDEKEKGHPYYWINTSPRRFSEHMQFLADNNYTVISLSEAVRIIECSLGSQPDNSSNPSNPSNPSSSSSSCLLGSQPKQPNNPSNPVNPSNPSSSSILFFSGSQPNNSSNPSNPSNPKYVALTFDDGYRDFYTHASPVIRDHGLKTTVYLPTGVIDNREKNLRGKSHLNWSEVRELQRTGTEFGSHTVTHRQLSELDESTVKEELKASKERIEDETGKKVEDFSYPYRFPEHDKAFMRRLREWLELEGYEWATTTRIGTSNQRGDKFFLKRIPVNEADDLRFFQAKLEGTYDWLNSLQLLLKRARNRSSRWRT